MDPGSPADKDDCKNGHGYEAGAQDGEQDHCANDGQLQAQVEHSCQRVGKISADFEPDQRQERPLHVIRTDHTVNFKISLSTNFFYYFNYANLYVN